MTASALEFWSSIANVTIVSGLFFMMMLRSREQRLSTAKSANQGRGQELKHQKRSAEGWGEAAVEAVAAQWHATEALQASEDKSYLTKLLHGLALPFEAMKVVAERTETYTVYQAYGGAPLVPVTLVLLVAVLVTFPSKGVDSFLIFALMLIGLIMLRNIGLASRDMEWQEIDEFLEHRVVRFTIKNSLAIFTLLASVFQLGGVAAKLFRKPQPGSNTSVDKAKAALKNVCDYFLIDFQSVSQQIANMENLKVYFKYAQVAGVVLAVVTFWIFYGGFLHRIFTLAAPVSVDDDEKATAQEFYQEMMGKAKGRKKARLDVYKTVKTASKYTTIFFLLSDTLVVTIVNGLLQVVSCHSDNTGTLLLDIDGLTQCFVGIHAWFSFIAVAILIWYIVSAVIVAPFVMADSDGIFSSPELDLRYVPQFYAKERLAKCALTFASVMFKQYPLVPRNLNFFVNMWLAYLATTTRPCSIMWVNVARVTVYLASGLIAFFVIVDAMFVGAWWIPLVLPPLVILLAIQFIVGVYSAWDIPKFSVSAPVGLPKGKKNATPFTDISMLRGSVHKIVAIQFWEHMWQGGDGINGVACTYQVDGTTLTAPAHLSTWFKFGDPSTEIVLEQDEHIVAMDDAGLRPMLCFGFATNKGRRYKVGDPTGDLPDDLESWKFQAKPGEIVGIAGHTNGRVQNLHFILQEQHQEEVDATEYQPLSSTA